MVIVVQMILMSIIMADIENNANKCALTIDKKFNIYYRYKSIYLYRKEEVEMVAKKLKRTIKWLEILVCIWAYVLIRAY